MEQQKEGRVFYIDFAKAFAMLIIVLGHYGYALADYNIAEVPNWLISWTNTSSMSPAITIFFIASGALLVEKHSGKLNLKEFYLNRIKKIFPLFWMVYLFAFLINACINGGINTGIPCWKFILTIFGMDGYFLYLGSNFYIVGEWFLGAIILFYVLFPAICWALENHPRLLAVCTLGAYVGVRLFTFQISMERNLVVCLTACILGMYIRKYVKRINNILGIAAMLISVILMFVPLELYYVFVANILGVSLYLTFFWLEKVLSFKTIKKCCERLSGLSYIIFLTHHVIILWVLRFTANYMQGTWTKLLFTIIIFALIYGVSILIEWIYGKCRKFWDRGIETVFFWVWDKAYKAYGYLIRHKLLMTALFATIMGGFVYYRFLFGNYLYMASYDATEQFWPQLSYLGEYILTEGFPGWSFSIGLGSHLEYSSLADFFYLISILAGKMWMPYLFSWLQLIKIVLSAVFMFLYLRKLDIKETACIYGALSYSLCAIIVIRGNWYHYSSEMVYLALLLYLLERFFQDKKWKCLVLLLFMIFSGRGAYFLCLYSIILFLYAVIRYWIIGEGKMKEFGIYIWRCTKIYILSVLISGIFWIPSIYTMLNADRKTERIIHRTAIFSLNNLTNICNGIVRAFRFDLAGSVDFYRGEYLNANLFYIGIVAILFVIWGLYYSRGKSRKVIITFLAMMLVYCCVPDVRFVLNGFIAYEHTKLSSAWIVAGLAACAAYGFQQAILENRIRKRTLIVSWISIVVVMLLCYAENIVGGLTVRERSLIYVFMFLIIYLIVLYCISDSKTLKRRSSAVILFIVCVELCISGYNAANNFTTSVHIVKKDQFQEVVSDRSAVFEEIKTLENEPFYRISANEYYNYANPLFGNYWDSSYYDTYVTSYGDFCKEVVPSAFSGIALGNGIDNNIALESLIGCKYIIKEQGEDAPYGCLYVETFDGYDIYENPYAKSIGVTYDTVITDTMFEKLTETEKGLALIHSVIIGDFENEYSNMDEKLKKDLYELREYLNSDYEQNDKYFSTYKWIEESEVLGSLDSTLSFQTEQDEAEISVIISKENEILNYQISFEVDSDIDTTLEVIGSDGKGHNIEEEYVLESGTNNIIFEVDCKKVQYFLLRFNDKGSYEVSNLRIMYQQLDDYYQYYNELYENYITRGENLNLIQFGQNHIEGDITVTEDKILLFSIPYNEGWKICVDGTLANILKVDYGLMAIEIPEGTHNIVMDYNRPLVKEGAVASCVGLAVFLLAILVEYRKRRKKNEKSISSSSGL